MSASTQDTVQTGWATGYMHELLSADQEVQLAFDAEAGVLAQERIGAGAGRDDLEDLLEVVKAGRAALDRLVASNMRLVAWMARRRCVAGAHGGLSLEDLTQEGMLGLIRAAHKFDFKQGCKFSTYATRWIANFQQRAVWANLPVHLDSHTAELLASLDAVTAHHWSVHREGPSLEVISDQLGVTRQRAMELTLLQRRDVRSLSEPINRLEGLSGWTWSARPALTVPRSPCLRAPSTGHLTQRGTSVARA